MSVTSVSSARWVSGSNTSGLRSRVVEYDVDSDDPLDSGSIIIDAAGIPLVGAAWLFGNDGDASITLKRKSLKLKSGEDQFTYWIVTCEYDDAVDDDRPESDDDTNTNEYHITPRFVAFRTPVEKAVYRGVALLDNVNGVPDGGDGKLGETGLNELLPITNSAGIRIVPAIEDDTHYLAPVIRYPAITWNPDLDDYVWAVNDAAIKLKWERTNLAGGGNIVMFEKTFPKYTLLISSITAEVDDSQGIPSYNITVETIYRPDTWRHRELDRGRHVIRDGGAPATTENPIMHAVVLRDEDDEIVIDDALFDGFGLPLDMTLPDFTRQARYLLWSIKEEKDFSASPITWELFTPLS